MKIKKHLKPTQDQESFSLLRNNVFCYSKAQRELGYTTCPYPQIIHDEVQWMIKEGMIEKV